MSKKTLALIFGLCAITILLVYVALNQKAMLPTIPQQPQQVVNKTSTASPTPAPAETVLSLSPNPLTVSASTPATLDVVINSNGQKITAVQLELTFDPKVVTIVSVAQPTKNPFIANVFPLMNKIDAKTGRVSYAVGVSPSAQSPTGAGRVATITLRTNLAAGEQSVIQFLPKTLVTAEGILNSVLKSTAGATVIGQ